MATPSGPVSSAGLYFDAQAGSNPRDALTLQELPKDFRAEGRSADPRATRETIDRREVTIVRRGEACMTFS